MRPTWDEYWISLLPIIATRSSCIRRATSAILVKNNRQLSSGYNGPPPGLKHCSELGGCLREKLKVPSGQRDEICRALHAEQNAILQCAINGQSTEGSIMYCSNMPCAICTKFILGANISKVIYIDHYNSPLSIEMFNESSCELIHYKP